MMQGEPSITYKEKLYRQSWVEANRQLPKRWYEQNFLTTAIAIVVGLAAVYYFLFRYGYPPLWLSSSMLLVYVIGFVWDIGTTEVMFQLKPAFKQRGLALPIREGNPWLEDEPTLKQQLFSQATLMEIIPLTVIYFLPGVAVAGVWYRLVAGLANLRARRQMLLTLHLFDAKRGV